MVGLGVQDLGTCGVLAMPFGKDQVLKASVGDAFFIPFGYCCSDWRDPSVPAGHWELWGVGLGLRG